jgi:putative oxidoreductase
MERYLGRWAPQCFALLRIVAGLMFAQHGTQKLFGFPGGGTPADDPVRIIGGVIELVGGILIAIGLFAGWAAFLASGEMAVAYFWRHAPNGFWPVINKGELAALYSFVFLYIAAHGPGVWSVKRGRARKG